MQKRETLNELRRVSRKLDYHPRTETVQQLVDSHLEALDKIDELTSKLQAVTEGFNLAAQSINKVLDDVDEGRLRVIPSVPNAE